MDIGQTKSALCQIKVLIALNQFFFQASAAVSGNIFTTGSNSLLDQTKSIQKKKHEVMIRTMQVLAPKLELIEPITKEELQPFLDALNN